MPVGITRTGNDTATSIVNVRVPAPHVLLSEDRTLFAGREFIPSSFNRPRHPAPQIRGRSRNLFNPNLLIV